MPPPRGRVADTVAAPYVFQRSINTTAPDPQDLGNLRNALPLLEQPHRVAGLGRAVGLRPRTARLAVLHHWPRRRQVVLIEGLMSRRWRIVAPVAVPPSSGIKCVIERSGSRPPQATSTPASSPSIDFETDIRICGVSAVIPLA